MSRSTYFLQECPTCGRRLQIKVRDLGREVSCGHCSRRFEALEPSESVIELDPIADLLRRAEDYLQARSEQWVAAEPTEPPAELKPPQASSS